MKMYLSILALSLLISCQQKENKTIQTDNSDTYTTPKQKETTAIEDDTIHLNFIDEKGMFTVESAIDSLHPRKYVKFKNDDLGKLKGKITTPTGGGNIRFNQIIFPDKTADGPFGIKLDINLTQKGTHILVIGPSQMADNPYVGKFKVQLQIN